MTEYEEQVLNVMLKWNTPYTEIHIRHEEITIIIDAGNDPSGYGMKTIQVAYEWFFRLRLLLGVKNVVKNVGEYGVSINDVGISCHFVTCPVPQGIKFDEKGTMIP